MLRAGGVKLLALQIASRDLRLNSNLARDKPIASTCEYVIT